MISARDRAQAIRTLEEAIAHLRSLPVKRSCSDCRMWRGGVCDAAQAVPPADVQASGCELWEWDECPF